MSRKPGLIQPTGLNYLNRGKEREGEDGEQEAHELRSKWSKLTPLSPSDSWWTYFKNFYTWFQSHLAFFHPNLQQVSFPSPVSVPTPSHPLFHHHFPPPPHIFLSVYLSTFTVTALESQESKLAPFPLPPSQQIHASLSLSIFLRHIG